MSEVKHYTVRLIAKGLAKSELRSELQDLLFNGGARSWDEVRISFFTSEFLIYGVKQDLAFAIKRQFAREVE